MEILVIFAVLLFLIAVNGLYVAGEFSAVSARRPRLAQMAEDGDMSAAWMLNLVENPERLDSYVAACQLGITLSSLVLGFYGQASIVAQLQPWLAQLGPTLQAAIEPMLSLIILICLTIFQVILGELMPKSIGLQFPERTALFTTWPMRWSMIIYRPLILLFNGAARLILKLMNAQPVGEHAHIHSPDEIVMLVEESSAGGVLDREERRLLVNTLELREETVRKIMLPRNRMLVASISADCDELLPLLANSPYSRLPLYDGGIDVIAGYVHIRDLLKLTYYRRNAPDAPEATQTLRDIMRPVLYVPESMPAEGALELMQRQHQHLVIAVDEYGGTAGMLTIEDLIEEIIGDFQDEFDVGAPPLVLRDDGRLSIRGDVAIAELNDLLELDLPDADVVTVGGLVTLQLGRLPKAGERVQVNDVMLRVDTVERNRVVRVSMALDEAQRRRWQEEQL